MKAQRIVVLDAHDMEHVIPSHFTACPRCDGLGRHDHPAFSNGITSSEWNDMDMDERDCYMNGGYDVTCERCDGERVVLTPDYDNLTDEQRALVDEDARGEREFDAIRRAELRFCDRES